MDFRPIKPKKIYEEIVEQIRSLMAQGDLKPGDKLLSEREFAEKLQVSRASVREALSALEMMGIVEIRTGEGTFVKETSADAIIQPLAMFISIERGSFFDIYEVRKIMESAAASLAAERATEDEIEKIEEALENLIKNANVIEQRENADAADTSFHYAIAEATHNNWLIRLMRTISDSFHRAVATSRQQLFRTPGNMEILAEQHRRIFAAIKARDSKLAEQAMLAHLTYAENEMVQKAKD